MIGSLCFNLLHRERIQKLEGNLKEKKKEKTFIFLCSFCTATPGGFPFAMDESIIQVILCNRQGSYCLKTLCPDLPTSMRIISNVNALTKSFFFKFMSYKSANLTDLFVDNLAID